MPDQSSGATPPRPPKLPVAPTPITTIDDLLERAEDRLIAKGSTVRVSPDNPDLKSPAALSEAKDSLAACGVTLVLDTSLGASDIRVEAPAPKP